MTTRIYRIIEGSIWRSLEPHDELPLRDIDRRDGYMHLSTEEQVLETARLHFAGCDDLIALEFDAEAFGAALKWEPSRGGSLFPHVYDRICAIRVRRWRRLVPDADCFRFGAGS